MSGEIKSRQFTRREFIKATTGALGASASALYMSRPGVATGQTPVGGVRMPSLEDERSSYRAWGWTWTSDKEPNFPSDSTYYVSNPDVHYDTEGDDLWSYLMMYIRTGQGGYLDRARSWARYFKQDYRSCVGTASQTLCSDLDNFDADHLYGWGLIAWYEYSGDAAALTEAEALGAISESVWASRTPGAFNMTTYGLRWGARHLLLATRLAEVTGKARWIALRDKLINLWIQSSGWDTSRGMYFVGDWQTDRDDVAGPGAYASGLRVLSAFHLGILAEAFAQAYRTTSNATLRTRLIAMANFVNSYGLDATYQYTGSWFGLNVSTGENWHSYNGYGGTTSFWDPVYTTSLVNVLEYGANYDNNPALRTRARHFFNRGTKGVYGSPTQRAAADNEVHHFVDSTFDTSSGRFYLAFNKGELQYTYALFTPVALDTSAPSPPAQLKVE